MLQYKRNKTVLSFLNGQNQSLICTAGVYFMEPSSETRPGACLASKKISRPPKGRFAPSPSGRMHLGNVFCALIAWLSARSAQGEILLRMEDLDPQRCRLEYALQLEEDLRWLGLDWDEGGSFQKAPTAFFQSRRSAFYEEALRKLEAQGLVYPCFCTRAELHAAEAPHLADGTRFYSGRCFRRTPEERARLSRIRRPSLRIHVPEETISFTDSLQGMICENLARDCGDFILRRSDGVHAYQLAVVCDDGSMGVTQVVRGRDLLSSTPRQIFLARLLGFPEPDYTHIPLLLSPDGVRLSKRDKPLDLGVLRQRYTAEELIGLLAFLCGLLPKKEALSARELLGEFSLSRLCREDIRLPPSLYTE